MSVNNRILLYIGIAVLATILFGVVINYLFLAGIISGVLAIGFATLSAFCVGFALGMMLTVVVRKEN